MNASTQSASSLPPACGMPAAVQPIGSPRHALGHGEQQQATPHTLNAQPAVSRSLSSCPACASGDVAKERARSWYGQRVWTRAPAAQPSSGASQTAPANGTGAPGTAVAADTAASSSPQTQAWKFSVMCYNILADTYAQYFAPKLYRDVPRPYLEWPHRLRLLLEEVRHWAPDVVCLQEVQHYHELEPEMRAAGYEGRFMRRTGRRRDGCATFWRADRLRACSVQRLDFAPLGLEDNVAMLLSLEPRAGGSGVVEGDLDSANRSALSSVRLLVATTHITFDPAKGDVKLGQVRTLLSRAAALAANPPTEEHQQPQLHHHHHHHQSHHSSGRQHAHPHHNPHQHQHPRQSYDQYNYHHHNTGGGDSNSASSASGGERPLPPPTRHPQQQHQQQCGHPAQPVGQSEVAAAGAAPGAQPRAHPTPPASSASSSLYAAVAAPSAVAAVEGRWRKAPVVPHSGSGDGAAVDAVPPPTAAVSSTRREHHHRHHHHNHQPQGGPASRPLQTLAIITGDFNSTAGSPLYQFVAHGSLDLARTNRKKLSGQLHGVCHTQYKPVSEVKQLHAKLTAAGVGTTAAATGACPDSAAAAAAAASAASVTGDTAGPSPPTVTASGASPPGTPPSTPTVAVTRTNSGSCGFGPFATAPGAVVQRLAGAAVNSAAAAISASSKAAAAAASHPAEMSPAARAAAAVQVLDAFLGSAAASGLHRGGVERWSERELRNAMGDQYDAALVQTTCGGGTGSSGVGGGGSWAILPNRALPSTASTTTMSSSLTAAAGVSESSPAAYDGPGQARYDSSSGCSAATAAEGTTQVARMGRQLNPPSVGRYSLSGTGAVTDAAVASGAGRHSLDLDRAPTAAASPLVVRHPLHLKSSYVEVARAEPSFTSIHSGFMGTVDFIWYTADSILQQWQQPLHHLQQQQPEGQPPELEGAQQPQRGPCSQPPPEGRRAPGSSGNGGGCGCDGGDGRRQMGGAAQPLRRFQLVPVAVLQPPNLELLPQGLPAAGWGSDHICVMTQFELRPV